MIIENLSFFIERLNLKNYAAMVLFLLTAVGSQTSAFSQSSQGSSIDAARDACFATKKRLLDDAPCGLSGGGRHKECDAMLTQAEKMHCDDPNTLAEFAKNLQNNIAGRNINCREMGTPVQTATKCMTQCAEAGAACSSGFYHPYDGSAGLGYLMGCKTGWPTWNCSFRYPTNGDVCTRLLPFGTTLCDKGGGKAK